MEVYAPAHVFMDHGLSTARVPSAGNAPGREAADRACATTRNPENVEERPIWRSQKKGILYDELGFNFNPPART